LHSVDEDKTMLALDESEVDGMNNGPDLPGSLASSEKISLNFVSNSTEGVSVNQTKVGEENRHEDGAK